jgi:hypothetical protein
MTNRELIEKATITTESLAAGGLLNPEQSDKFLDYVIDETSLKGYSRIVKFKASQKYIDKINVHGRVAVPKEEAVDPGVRRGISSSRLVLEHREIMVPFEISDILKEENIEEDAIQDRIIKMMATRCANDTEELNLGGNTVGPAALENEIYEGGSTSLYIKDTLLSMYNGYLKLAAGGHVVDAAGEVISSGLISRALNAMPNKFKKNRGQLKFFMSPEHEQAYREKVSTRATQSGDAALSATGNIPAFGVELVPVGLLSSTPKYVENTVANTDGTTATALAHAPIDDLVITPTTLAGVPSAKYIEGVDYSVNETAGTWIRLGGGSIPSGGTVKCTYKTAGRILLTNPQNMIYALGREIRIEKDRNIYKGVNEYAITLKVWAAIEETDAVVLLKNVAVPT